MTSYEKVNCVFPGEILWIRVTGIISNPFFIPVEVISYSSGRALCEICIFVGDQTTLLYPLEYLYRKVIS